MHEGTILSERSVMVTDEGAVATKGFSSEGCCRISTTAPAVYHSCLHGSVITMGAPDEGPNKVAVEGRVVDEVETRLVADNGEPPSRVRLRPKILMPGELDIPVMPDPE